MTCIKKNRRYIIAFLIVFALIFIRFCAYGFEYFYQLDDYIQYHNYVSRGLTKPEIVDALGLLAARPLAGLADIYVWSSFWDSMILGVLTVSLMFAASAVLFYAVFKRRFGTGVLFLVVYTLLPMAFEGTYWMSASTRVVSGLFFAALALFFFDKFLKGGRWYTCALYMITQVLASGFYEQALVFTVTSVMLLGILDFKKTKRAYFALFSLFAMVLYFGFTSMFSDSALYGGRTGLVLPVSLYYFKTFLPSVIKQVMAAFGGGFIYTMTKGAVRGVSLIFEDGLYLYFIAAAALCAVFFIFSRSEKSGVKLGKTAAFIVGALLFIAPITPFFVLESSWFSLRSTVMSLCGLALICDTALRLIFKDKNAVISVCAAVLALWCCAASASELHDYKETYENDAKIYTAAANAIEKDGLVSEDISVGFFNVQPSYLSDQNFYFHEHIHGVTESTWALTGAVEYMLGPDAPDVSPLPAHCFSAWNYDSMTPDNFDALYLYDGENTMTRVYAEKTDTGWDILYENGSKAGSIELDGKEGYLSLR